MTRHPANDTRNTMEATTSARSPSIMRIARLCLLAVLVVVGFSCGAPSRSTDSVVLDDQQLRVVTIQLAGIG